MADIDSLMSKPWFARAVDPKTPTLTIEGGAGMPLGQATVQTMSSEYNGKEILYPTIRMIDGELKKLNEKTAKDLAIEKGDFVEYDTPELATQASKEISNYIGFARDPAGTMDREEKKYQEQMKNMKMGTPFDFLKGVMSKPTNQDTKMKLMGEDYRNYLEFNRTSIPFMILYDYFNPEKRGE